MGRFWWMFPLRYSSIRVDLIWHDRRSCCKFMEWKREIVSQEMLPKLPSPVFIRLVQFGARPATRPLPPTACGATPTPFCNCNYRLSAHGMKFRFTEEEKPQQFCGYWGKFRMLISIKNWASHQFGLLLLSLIDRSGVQRGAKCWCSLNI